MQINTQKKDIIWNYLGIFFSLGSQVIWLPVLIHYLPPDILGLWYVFVSIGGMVELLDSGFTRECKIVCVNRYCMNLLYAPYWGKQR